MRSRIEIGTVVLVVVAAPILGLVVLVRPSPGTEAVNAEQSSANIGASVQSAAAAAAAVTTVQQPAQARRTAFGTGGTVTLFLERTDLNGPKVSPGTPIVWQIVAQVSDIDNAGLALISVDLVQDPTNLELIDIPIGVRPAGMVDFDRPNGIANPDPNGPGSAYGGSQITGATGGLNLIQIGGAQNTFGAPGETIGLDTDVDLYIGHGGQIIATGSFNAPGTLGGPYTFDLWDGVANTLDQLAQPPDVGECWPVHEATVDVDSNGTISFTVVP